MSIVCETKPDLKGITHNEESNFYDRKNQTPYNSVFAELVDNASGTRLVCSYGQYKSPAAY